MVLINILSQIEEAVRHGGEIVLGAEREQGYISSKEGHANFVTVYDKKVQEYLQSRLLEIIPEAEFLGEEDLKTHQMPDDIIQAGADATDVESCDVMANGTTADKYIFIVDPIDGTTNFIKDYKVSSISVGLLYGGEKVLGVVYNPYLDEMFTAIRGKGAFVNGRPIHVSDSPISQGLVLFGTSPYNDNLAKKSFDMAYEYFRRSMDVRRSGSAALDLCNVAAGRAELFFELSLQPWDFTAGALILQEAGGIVTTIDGCPLPLTKQSSVLATNNRVRSGFD